MQCFMFNNENNIFIHFFQIRRPDVFLNSFNVIFLLQIKKKTDQSLTVFRLSFLLGGSFSCKITGLVFEIISKTERQEF